MFRLSGLDVDSPDVDLTYAAHRPKTAAASPDGANADIEANAKSRAIGRVTLRLASTHRGKGVPACVFDHSVEQGGINVLSFGRAGDAWALRTDELATFVVRPDGHTTCHPDPGCNPHHIASMFVDRVIPHLVDALGHLALHASSVAFDDVAAAFIGPPGAGKSTLGAGLCPPAAFLSDDCAALELAGDQVWLHPSYPFARLNPDSAAKLESDDALITPPTRTTKWRAPRESPKRAVSLKTIYVLSEGDLAIRRLGQRDSIVELARQIFRIAPTDRKRLVIELDRLDALAGRAAVKSLRLPRNFEALPAVRKAIQDDLAADSPRL